MSIGAPHGLARYSWLGLLCLVDGVHHVL
jgi:hypothetical protein